MRTFQRIIGVPGLNNLGVVRDGAVYRSAQPEYTAWATTLTGTIPISILNLREESMQTEVEAAGLKYFQLRLNVFSDVTVEDFDLVVQTLSENQPILIHCLDGKNRTGVACAAYRMAVDGWTLDEALEEMAAYGGDTIVDVILRKHLEAYAEAKGFK